MHGAHDRQPDRVVEQRSEQLSSSSALARASWRAVWVNLASVPLLIVTYAIGIVSPDTLLQWVAVLCGLLMTGSGWSIVRDRRLIGLVEPTQVRGWMRPVASGLFVIGVLMVIVGVRVLLGLHALPRNSTP
jgi:hypothetical protein